MGEGEVATKGATGKMVKAEMVKFERRASRVVFDHAFSRFVVTRARRSRSQDVRMSDRKDSQTWLPSVSAVATLYDRGCVPQGLVKFAARAVGCAFDAGDRELLDTEAVRKAAETVRNMSCVCRGPSSPVSVQDVGQAMRRLSDEIAAVRFLKTAEDDFDERSVMPVMERGISECLLLNGFFTGLPASMRRTFMFCLNRGERTKVIYTLATLAFDAGACPLLSVLDRRTLRMRAANISGLSDELSRESLMEFFRVALSMMREARLAGRPTVCNDVTQERADG